MKFKSIIPFVAGLIILQSCSTPKNDVLWVGGITSECDLGSEKTTCLKVFKGDDLKNEKWIDMSAQIEGFEFEEGYMKKIEVKKEDVVIKDVSSVKYTLIKELDKKEDPRIHLKGNWVLASINEGPINKMIVLPTLNFNLKEMRISGNGGCNLYSATIEELTSKRIKIKESLGTLMECATDNIEIDYHTMLSRIDTYKIKDEMLLFYDESGTEILTFIKVETPKINQALTGEWKNIRIHGEKIDAESIPEIVFDLDKMMAGGKDGCNSFNAPIKSLSNTELHFGDIAATKMMCPDMETPQQFLEALDQVMTFKVENGELILLDKEGNELLAFTK